MEQIIEKGCVYLALKSNIISKNDLLNYIIQHSNELNSMIAYRQLCCQDLDHEDFFDRIEKVNRAVYAYIYVLSGGESCQLKIKKSELEIMMKLNDCIRSLTGYKDDGYLIVAGMNVVTPAKSNYRSFVSFDRVEALTIKNKGELNLVLERIEKISTIEDYYKVVKPKYIDLLKRSSIEKLVSQENLDKIKSLFTIEEGVIPNIMYDLNAGTMEIHGFSKSIKSYILGFEFFSHSTKDTDINQRLIMASKTPDELVEMIRKHSVYSVEAINTSDTLSNDWKDYLPFDIYPYNDENHIYVFTRPEFEWILNNRKNPWNNKDLSSEMLDYIDFLQKFSAENNFPTSKPMKEMWMKPEFNSKGSMIMKILGIPFSYFQ